MGLGLGLGLELGLGLRLRLRLGSAGLQGQVGRYAPMGHYGAARREQLELRVAERGHLMLGWGVGRGLG